MLHSFHSIFHFLLRNHLLPTAMNENRPTRSGENKVLQTEQIKREMKSRSCRHPFGTPPAFTKRTIRKYSDRCSSVFLLMQKNKKTNYTSECSCELSYFKEACTDAVLIFSSPRNISPSRSLIDRRRRSMEKPLPAHRVLLQRDQEKEGAEEQNL